MMPCATPRQIALAMLGAAHRRVHLQFACRAARNLRRTASDDAASPRSSRHPWRRRRNSISCLRRNMQHMHLRAGSRGRCGSAARVAISAAVSSRQTGCEDGSPGTRKCLALVQPRLVLAVEGGAPARLLQDRGDALEPFQWVTSDPGMIFIFVRAFPAKRARVAAETSNPVVLV